MKSAKVLLACLFLLIAALPANALVKRSAHVGAMYQDEIAAYANKRIVVSSFTIGKQTYAKGTILDITKTSGDGKWIYFLQDGTEQRISGKKVVSGKVTKLNRTSVTIPYCDPDGPAKQISLYDLVQPMGNVLDRRMSCYSLNPDVVDVDGLGDLWVLYGFKKGTTYIVVEPFYSDKAFKVKVRVK